MPARGQLFAGDYRVVEPLSAGGMGAVYIVDQLSTGKQRALKLMHPALIADPGLRKRFEQEARIGARIDSAHVVEVQAAGIDPATGVPWLVMELLHGEDLATRIERSGGLEAGEVAEIFEQVCHALGAAHRAGIIHRDLKPENLFVGKGRHAGARIEVKVLDFGIAKLAEESGTKSTAAMGSPAWMAPEQTERGAIDARADVWALGLVVYAALTGRMFWKRVDEKWLQLLREIMIEPLPSATQRATEQGRAGRLPPGFDAWFARCVARDPNARFADASVLWEALRPILRDQPSLATQRYASATVPVAPSPSQMRLPTAPTMAPSTEMEVHAPAPPSARDRSSFSVAAIVAILAIVGFSIGAIALVGAFVMASRTANASGSSAASAEATAASAPVVSAPPANASAPASAPHISPRALRPAIAPAAGGGPRVVTPRTSCTCSGADPLCSCL